MKFCLTPEQEERRKLVLAERLEKKRASVPRKSKRKPKDTDTLSESVFDEQSAVVLAPDPPSTWRKRGGGVSIRQQVAEAAALVAAKGLPTDILHVEAQLGESWKGDRKQLHNALCMLRYMGRVAPLPPGYGQGRRHKPLSAS